MIKYEDTLKTQKRFSKQNKVSMDAKERDHAVVLRRIPNVCNLTKLEKKLYKKYWTKTNIVRIVKTKKSKMHKLKFSIITLDTINGRPPDQADAQAPVNALQAIAGPMPGGGGMG